MLLTIITLSIAALSTAILAEGGISVITAHLFYIPIMIIILFYRDRFYKVSLMIFGVSSLYVLLTIMYGTFGADTICRFIVMNFIGNGVAYYINVDTNRINKICSENKRYITLLNNTDTLVWVLSDPETVKYANRTFVQYFNSDINASIARNIPLEELIKHQDTFNAVIQDNRYIFEHGVKLKRERVVTDLHGNKRILSVTKTPKFGHGNTIKYIICTAEDITSERMFQCKMEAYTNEMTRQFITDMLVCIKHALKCQCVQVYRIDYDMQQIDIISQCNDNSELPTLDRIESEHIPYLWRLLSNGHQVTQTTYIPENERLIFNNIDFTTLPVIINGNVWGFIIFDEQNHCGDDIELVKHLIDGFSHIIDAKEEISKNCIDSTC